MRLCINMYVFDMITILSAILISNIAKFYGNYQNLQKLTQGGIDRKTNNSFTLKKILWNNIKRHFFKQKND